MYKVIKFFTDLHDNDYAYNVGDVFPRVGISVSESRLAELAGSHNKQHTQQIAIVEEKIAEKTAKKKTKKRTKKTVEK